MNRSEKILKYSIGILFLLLYMLVATISAICSIDFFNLSHNQTMSICLAIAFELGAMCSLCAGVFMKSNRTLSFGLFTLLTLFQMMGNVFHSYTNLLPNYIEWINLFGLEELEEIAQKRIVAVVSGAILPIVALGFIKCFVDYNDKQDNALEDKSDATEQVKQVETETKTEKQVEQPAVKVDEKPKQKEELKKVQQVEPKKTEQHKVEKPKVEQTKVATKVEQSTQQNKKHENTAVDLDPSTLI